MVSLQILSIHSLIRGWPEHGSCALLEHHLSIHSLIRGWPTPTKRTPAPIKSFNSQPHTRLTLPDYRNTFRPKSFQFTASYEADPQSHFLQHFSHSFNSQPHTRLTAVVNPWTLLLDLSIHSLIRGWPAFCVSYSPKTYSFNSQPHTRLTIVSHTDIYNVSSFNSQPHTRLTMLISMLATIRIVFQFTASYEADLAPDAPCMKHGSFQFTASYEADHGAAEARLI